jgi:flagellin-like protein
MKANQKFVKADEAVSPVIAVILMVAITVVLAATVYVWVSGFGAQSGNPQKSISLTSAGALSNTWKNYTVASGTSGMKYSDLKVSVDGVDQPFDTAADCSTPAVASPGFGVCHGGSALASSNNVVSAGDIIMLKGIASGKTLRILDSQANAVMLTLTIG